MKAETAALLRAVVKLAESDLDELRDAVAEIDDREAAHNGSRLALEIRLERLEQSLREHVATYDRFAHPSHPVPEGFSVKAP